MASASSNVINLWSIV